MTSALVTAARSLDRRRVGRLLGFGLALTLISSPAFAQAVGGTSDITTFFQNIVNIITGTTGKVIAVLAIVGVAMGAMFGALSWRQFGGVTVGILMLFSASWIVTQMTGGA